MGRERLDPDLVDWDDPFELDDDNEFHLLSHEHYTAGDLSDILANDAVLFPADTEKGPADWLLVGQPPGEPPLVVPLAPPQSLFPTKVRPIGIYRAPAALTAGYQAGAGKVIQ